MTDTEGLKNRLENWKFKQAKNRLTGKEDEFVREGVEALAAVFEDSGWFYGPMGFIVDAAVQHIIKKIEEGVVK